MPQRALLWTKSVGVLEVVAWSLLAARGLRRGASRKGVPKRSLARGVGAFE